MLQIFKCWNKKLTAFSFIVLNFFLNCHLLKFKVKLSLRVNYNKCKSYKINN